MRQYQLGLDEHLYPRLYDVSSIFRLPDDDNAVLFNNVSCADDRDCRRNLPHRCFSHAGEKWPCRHNGRCHGFTHAGARSFTRTRASVTVVSGTVLAVCRILELFLLLSPADRSTLPPALQRTWHDVHAMCSNRNPAHRQSAQAIVQVLERRFDEHGGHQLLTANRSAIDALYQQARHAYIERGEQRCLKGDQFC